MEPGQPAWRPQRPMKISPELFQLLAACLEYSRQSEGAFDITVGPLMKVWGFYKGTGHLPHRAEVAAAMARVGYRHIHLDAAARHGVVRPAGRGDGPRRHRQRLRRGPDGGSFETKRRRPPRWWRAPAAAFMGWGRRPSQPQGWAVEIKDPWEHAKTVAEVFLKDMSHVHFGQLREVFPGGRPHLRPHHGPAHGISGAGQRIGFGRWRRAPSIARRGPNRIL